MGLSLLVIQLRPNELTCVVEKGYWTIERPKMAKRSFCFWKIRFLDLLLSHFLSYRILKFGINNNMVFIEFNNRNVQIWAKSEQRKIAHIALI